MFGAFYLPFGPLNALTYGNALTLSAAYDTDYNPTNRTISGGIANWTYTTDKNSNVTQAGPTTYGYDALDRVNGENGATTAYTYDATSNRLTKVQGGTTTSTVPSTSNKISAVGGTSYTYDTAGNITAIGTNGYVWSAAGLMKEYKISGVSTATYTYNAFNQRTKKVTGGVTTHYVYGAGGLLLGEYTSAAAMVREYVYLNSAPLAQVNSGAPETVTYLHTDHLDTPRFGTNAAGTQVWAWANDAFGISTPSGAVTVNIRMPGQYNDAESGLFYNWNRYYSPAIGRYISSDRIGLAGGLNTFNYAAVSPVMHLDPMGLDVTAVFDVKKRTLTVTDNQTQEAITIKNVFSGNGKCTNNPKCNLNVDEGPVPTGTYLLGQGYQSSHDLPGDNEWYKLYGKDGNGGYDYEEIPLKDPDTGATVIRGYFNLHTGLRSNGCITVPSDVSEDASNYPSSKQFDQLHKLLNNTKLWEYKAGDFYLGTLTVQ